MMATPPREREAPSDEVELAADPRHLSRPQALRGHLPGQVDLERGVDRDEAIELRHDRRDRERSADVSMFTSGFSWRNVEEPARPHRLGDVHAPAVDPLRRVGDDAALDQRDRRVDQQRVEREVTMVPERLEHGLGNRADADLHRGPVGHQPGDVPSDERARPGRSSAADTP